MTSRPQVPVPHVLVAEDTPEIASLVTRIVTALGCTVKVVASADDFQAAIEEAEPDMILLDLVMPDTDGIQLLHRLKEIGFRQPVLLMSGSDARIVDVAARLGRSLGLAMLGALAKPFSPAELEKYLRQGLRLRPVLTENALRAAIDHGEIISYYQPKVPASELTPEGVSAESLVRWQHPTLGVLQPFDFLPLAESAGLMPLLTDRVFGLALEELRHWRVRNVPLTLSVNLSPSMIHDLALPDHLAALALAAGVPCEAITLELTEEFAVKDFERAMTVASRFRIKGFGLSIDDFGTGHASLMHLVRMPFNELKIDQTFVAEIGRSRDVESVIKATVLLARHLNMSICGEGVETVELRRFLREAGADTIQGYLVSKPLSPTDWADWVRQHQPA